MTRANDCTEADGAGAISPRSPMQARLRLRGILDWRFADASLERDYRAFFLDQDKRNAILAIGVYALLKASFAIIDLLVQPPDGLSAVLAFRFGFVGVCVLAMLLLGRVRRHAHYDALVFGWAVLVVAATFYTISHRPPDHFGFIATTPIQMLLFFAFFRNRFELQLAACLLAIGADLFTLMALRVPMATPMLVQVCMTYGLALLVGVVVSHQLKHSRRRLFGVLLHEREMGEAMRELAYRDELTGVLNRRSFLQQAGAAWRDQVSTRHGCVLILDLDHFKDLNDRHGHDAGDQALIRFARMVEAVKRDVDVFGRIGGEEFALLLPGLPQAQAQVIAEAIMAGCRALQAGQGETLSVSIGIAAILPSDAGLAATMLRADRALYQAKEEGRGRSCTADWSAGAVTH